MCLSVCLYFRRYILGNQRIMCLYLCMQVLRNQEMRVKFPELPEKFMESELELNEELQTLHVIATTPEFYPILSEVSHVISHVINSTTVPLCPAAECGADSTRTAESRQL